MEEVEVSNATGAAAFLFLLSFPIAVEKKTQVFSSSFSLKSFNVCVFFRGRIRRENNLHVAREQLEAERRGVRGACPGRWHGMASDGCHRSNSLFFASLSVASLVLHLFFPCSARKKGDQPPFKTYPST